MDDRELSQDDATLLGELIETLAQETETRRINASRVLAGLVGRIPEDRRRLLLTPLVRQMVALAPVRMTVGPRVARRLVHQAMPQDRREVAEQFVLDLLHGDEIRWTKPSGGSPNLDEATTLVREALDLALEVRESDGLADPADSTLRQWLLTRRVQIPGKSHTLPFSELNSRVAQHETHLLALLGSDYSDQAISAFESDDGAIDSTDATLAHVRAVFEQMADSGQEQRAILWPLLTRLASVPSVQAVDAASVTAATCRDLASAPQARDFLSALASRLIQHFDNPDDHEPDWFQRGRQFNDLLTFWASHLDDATGLSIMPLASAWALNPNCTEIAVPSLDLLLDHGKDAWDEALVAMLHNDLAVVPRRICSYVGEHAPSLPDGRSATLIQWLDATIQQNQPEQDASASYREVVASVPRETWSQPPWHDHLERLFMQTQGMYQNPAYLAAFLPSVVHLFDAAPEGRTAQLIAPLFANAAGTPDAYVVLHAGFAGHWPTTGARIGDYSPDALAEGACQFIEQHRNRADLGDVLASLTSLSEAGVTSDTTDSRIASVMPIIWRVDHRRLTEDARYVTKALQPSHTADILNGDQPSDVSQEDMAAFLQQVAARYDAEACFDVFKAILGQQPSTLFDTPDGAVSQWLAAVGDRSDDIARSALNDDSFNDEQHRRVAAKLTDAFWVSGDMQPLEAVLRRAGARKTRASLLDRLDDIAGQSLSIGKKADLSSRLIASLPSLSGDELVVVAQLVRKLGGQGALEDSHNVLNALDDDQKRTLQTVFPDSKHIGNVSAS